MNEDIKKILDLAVLAPSGENCQPWRFEVRGNEIKIFLVPEKDQSLYNFEQKGSLVAIGALIENTLIASSHLGYTAELTLYPEGESRDLIAQFFLIKSQPKDEPLYPFIPRRVTNRKVYKPVSLTPLERAELLRQAMAINGVELRFIENQEKKQELAGALSVNECLIFQNKHLHHFFFTHLNWTKEEDEKKRIGFYIKTLELAPAQINALKLFKRWPLLRLFNLLGVSKAIAGENAKVYASASAFGLIVTPGNSRLNLVDAGRAVERIWLTAAKLGLSLQPITGILFFHQRISAGDINQFSSSEVKMVEEAYVKIASLFGVSKGTAPFLFRVGRADPPSARSARLPAQVDYL